MSKYERVARFFKIVTLVRSNPRLTRDDLARLCEVDSVRTIQRDINSLVIAGVPIFWSGDGYEIMPNFFLPSLGFDEQEAVALILAIEAFMEKESENCEHVKHLEYAILKIERTFSPRVKEAVEEYF